MKEKSLQEEKCGVDKLLGLDVGDKTIGVARGSTDFNIATPVKTLKRINGIENDLKNIEDLIVLYKTDKIVIGLPLGLRGNQTDQTKKVIAFADKLKESVTIPVVFYDERFTTNIAHDILHRSGIKNKHHKKVIDQIAAVLILEDFMTFQNSII